ncbi:S-adenosylmethionine sensor upstream of mTORC1 [Nymphon striatum]|nr:S-adenosylmethionine sensor upstream of mTORC1 [Nymphon striatum]
MNNKHIELSSVIKSVHEDLRKKFRSKDENVVWAEHKKDETARNRYAKAMHELATSFWKENNLTTRIEWIYEFCKFYFNEGRLEEIIKKENRNLSEETYTRISRSDMKLKLLDVGSCYNPFLKYSTEFDVLAVDLSPATKDVLQCDFLELQISNNLTSPQIGNSVESLVSSSFDIIIFSLLLEYFPSTRQRYLCCKNASDLLKLNGLLFIITPDSKHQNHNSKMMKSWKEAMLNLNLVRVKYEKLTHLHCMAFRKVSTEVKEKVYLREKFNDEKLHELLYIPQDSNKYEEKTPSETRTQEEDEIVRDGFAELPLL